MTQRIYLGSNPEYRSERFGVFMSEKCKDGLLVSTILFVGFVAFTFCATKVDVASIGIDGSRVGFSTLNGAFRDAVGFSNLFYVISKILGYLAFPVIALFAFLGILQLVKGKSLKKVDMDIYALGIFYVLTGVAYFLFNKIVINYRPLDMGEGPEPSYPSSHTMLGICVFFTAAMQFKTRIKNEKIRTIAVIASYVMMVLLVLTRMLSGVHWLTDIVGGVILSAFLISLYCDMLLWIEGRK